MLPVGTVLFTSRAGIGKTAILAEELKTYGETIGAGSTFVEVSGKQMAAMELMMPPTMEEQKKIGEFIPRLLSRFNSE